MIGKWVDLGARPPRGDLACGVGPFIISIRDEGSTVSVSLNSWTNWFGSREADGVAEAKRVGLTMIREVLAQTAALVDNLEDELDLAAIAEEVSYSNHGTNVAAD